MQTHSPVILVVDDSEIVRTSLTNLLQGCGCEIISCIDGLEGIQKALLHKPSLIIVDILMPNLDGIKMLQVIKILEELKRIPILVLSANINKTNVLAAMEAGADKILNKPFKENDLIKAVNELLDCNIKESEKSLVLYSSDDDDIKNDLQKMFLDSFPLQKKNIIDLVGQRNKLKLKNIFHELKGIGSTVGFPQVTDISRKVEYTLANNEVDWNTIIRDCEKLFLVVDKKDYTIDLEN
ncbi:MAG: response regulator [Ignavibacteriaceae bacterium]|nr:response regulator [Ignavibacteriaceae bacterium]